MKLLRPAMLEITATNGTATEEQITNAVWAQRQNLSVIDSRQTEAEVRQEVRLALETGIELRWVTTAANGPTFNLTALGQRKLKPKTAGPRRQHYLARMYLKRFTATDRNVAVYDRTTDGVTRQNTRDTAVVRNLYTVQDSGGTNRYEIEFGLAESEAASNSIITKMSQGQQITGDERIIMSIFLGNMVCRTPAMMETVQSMANGLVAWLAQHYVDRGILQSEFERDMRQQGKSEKEIKELSSHLTGREFTIATDDKFAMTTALNGAIPIADVMYARHWHVLRIANDRKSFITSDAPVTLAPKQPGRATQTSPIGFASDDASIWFPLSANAALVMEGWGEGLDYDLAREKAIREFNLRTAQNCKRFIIGRDERLVESIARASGLRYTKWNPRGTTSHGTNKIRFQQ